MRTKSLLNTTRRMKTMKIKKQIMQKFTLEDLKNPVTKQSIINKMQQTDANSIRPESSDNDGLDEKSTD